MDEAVAAAATQARHSAVFASDRWKSNDERERCSIKEHVMGNSINPAQVGIENIAAGPKEIVADIIERQREVVIEECVPRHNSLRPWNQRHWSTCENLICYNSPLCSTCFVCGSEQSYASFSTDKIFS
jgi:hypothetical protein